MGVCHSREYVCKHGPCVVTNMHAICALTFCFQGVDTCAFMPPYIARTLFKPPADIQIGTQQGPKLRLI